MEDVQNLLQTLQQLCDSINDFKQTQIESATYRSPIIDFGHPHDYSQRAVKGLTRFFVRAQNERDHVKAILDSGKPPRDLTTNTPNLIAIWEEVLRSPRPICSVAHHLDCGPEGQLRVDVVGDGGNVWLKINTIKEARLRAEFREQDSYINSDYDSDSSASSSTSRAPPTLSNSLIVQAASLVRAVNAFRRPIGLPTPKIHFVLNRLKEFPEGGYEDDRIPATFAAIRAMGVELILGSQPKPILPDPKPRLLIRPTKRILLDLSVIVALCCDSTHRPLPKDNYQLESVFRPRVRNEAGEVELAEHTNASKDLRDQLAWETRHPVIEEIQAGLQEYTETEVQWFVTREVKERTPGIVDLIGGPGERARARALYGESEDPFWKGSRYEGREGILRNIRISVLEDSEDMPSLDALSLDTASKPLFERGITSVCQRMVSVVEGTTSTDTSRPTTPAPPPEQQQSYSRKKRGQRWRSIMQQNPIFPQSPKLPSGHTLRTMLNGLQRGMTVLTNNRGAVGKLVREMGILDGFPFDDEGGQGESASGQTHADMTGDEKREEKAVLWVVNPSSLAEWRRLEVEEANAALQAAAADGPDA